MATSCQMMSFLETLGEMEALLWCQVQLQGACQTNRHEFQEYQEAVSAAQQ